MAVSFYSSTQFSGTKIYTTGDGFNKCSPDSIKFKSNRISAAAAAAATSTERPTSSSSYLSFNISSSSSKSSLYQVLGISMNATYQEIKSAYRKLARVFHPDVIDDMNSKHTSSADHFMEIHDAYSTLSDPSRRADYDRDLLFTTRRRTPLCYTTSSSSSSSRPSSNWETDQCW